MATFDISGYSAVHTRYTVPKKAVILVLESDREQYSLDVTTHQIPCISSSCHGLQSSDGAPLTQGHLFPCYALQTAAPLRSLSDVTPQHQLQPIPSSDQQLAHPLVSGPPDVSHQPLLGHSSLTFPVFSSMCTSQYGLVDTFSPSIHSSLLYQSLQSGSYAINSVCGGVIRFSDLPNLFSTVASPNSTTNITTSSTTSSLRSASLASNPQEAMVDSPASVSFLTKNDDHNTTSLPSQRTIPLYHAVNTLLETSPGDYTKTINSISLISQLLGAYPQLYLSTVCHQEQDEAAHIAALTQSANTLISAPTHATLSAVPSSASRPPPEGGALSAATATTTTLIPKTTVPPPQPDKHPQSLFPNSYTATEHFIFTNMPELVDIFNAVDAVAVGSSSTSHLPHNIPALFSLSSLLPLATPFHHAHAYPVELSATILLILQYENFRQQTSFVSSIISQETPEMDNTTCESYNLVTLPRPMQILFRLLRKQLLALFYAVHSTDSLHFSSDDESDDERISAPEVTVSHDHDHDHDDDDEHDEHHSHSSHSDTAPSKSATTTKTSKSTQYLKNNLFPLHTTHVPQLLNDTNVTTQQATIEPPNGHLSTPQLPDQKQPSTDALAQPAIPPALCSNEDNIPSNGAPTTLVFHLNLQQHTLRRMLFPHLHYSNAVVDDPSLPSTAENNSRTQIDLLEAQDAQLFISNAFISFLFAFITESCTAFNSPQSLAACLEPVEGEILLQMYNREIDLALQTRHLNDSANTVSNTAVSSRDVSITLPDGRSMIISPQEQIAIKKGLLPERLSFRLFDVLHAREDHHNHAHDQQSVVNPADENNTNSPSPSTALMNSNDDPYVPRFNSIEQFILAQFITFPQDTIISAVREEFPILERYINASQSECTSDSLLGCLQSNKSPCSAINFQFLNFIQHSLHQVHASQHQSHVQALSYITPIACLGNDNQFTLFSPDALHFPWTSLRFAPRDDVSHSKSQQSQSTILQVTNSPILSLYNLHSNLYHFPASSELVITDIAARLRHESAKENQHDLPSNESFVQHIMTILDTYLHELDHTICTEPLHRSDLIYLSVIQSLLSPQLDLTSIEDDDDDDDDEGSNTLHASPEHNPISSSTSLITAEQNTGTTTVPFIAKIMPDSSSILSSEIDLQLFVDFLQYYLCDADDDDDEDEGDAADNHDNDEDFDTQDHNISDNTQTTTQQSPKSRHLPQILPFSSLFTPSDALLEFASYAESQICSNTSAISTSVTATTSDVSSPSSSLSACLNDPAQNTYKNTNISSKNHESFQDAMFTSTEYLSRQSDMASVYNLLSHCASTFATKQSAGQSRVELPSFDQVAVISQIQSLCDCIAMYLTDCLWDIDDSNEYHQLEHQSSAKQNPKVDLSSETHNTFTSTEIHTGTIALSVESSSIAHPNGHPETDTVPFLSLSVLIQTTQRWIRNIYTYLFLLSEFYHYSTEIAAQNTAADNSNHLNQTIKSTSPLLFPSIFRQLLASQLDNIAGVFLVPSISGSFFLDPSLFFLLLTIQRLGTIFGSSHYIKILLQQLFDQSSQSFHILALHLCKDTHNDLSYGQSSYPNVAPASTTSSTTSLSPEYGTNPHHDISIEYVLFAVYITWQALCQSYLRIISTIATSNDAPQCDMTWLTSILSLSCNNVSHNSNITSPYHKSVVHEGTTSLTATIQPNMNDIGVNTTTHPLHAMLTALTAWNQTTLPTLKNRSNESNKQSILKQLEIILTAHTPFAKAHDPLEEHNAIGSKTTSSQSQIASSYELQQSCHYMDGILIHPGPPRTIYDAKAAFVTNRHSKQKHNNEKCIDLDPIQPENSTSKSQSYHQQEKNPQKSQHTGNNIFYQQTIQPHISVVLISSFHPNSVRPALQFNDIYHQRFQLTQLPTSEQLAEISGHIPDPPPKDTNPVDLSGFDLQPITFGEFSPQLLSHPFQDENTTKNNHNSEFISTFLDNHVTISDGCIHIHQLLPNIHYKLGLARKYGA